MSLGRPGRGSLVTGKRAVLEAIRSGRAMEVLVAESARTTPAVREVLDAASRSPVATRRLPREDLDALAQDHRGVAAYLHADVRVELTERDLADTPYGEDALVVVLDGITDPQNLGAAARAAEAAGAAMLVTRVRRAAGVTPAAVRASAGALLTLPHARVANVSRAIGRLKGDGFTVVGLDASAPLSIYEEECPPGRVVLVVGSEGEGISRLVRESCDMLLSLPMRGQVASMNASASLAAALYAFVVPSRIRR